MATATKAWRNTMAKKLRFRFNAEKFVNAVAYLAQACPESSKLTICKQLYFADREHLTRFGRPILGDHYYKLPHGPIPTQGLDILRGKSSPAWNALLNEYVSVDGQAVHLKKAANKKVFSKSDLDVLRWVVNHYGHFSASALRAASHNQAPWSESEFNSPIDYALFFDDRPGSREMKELAEAEQESRDLLRPYAARR
jgi:uncharacterized phage-associated protein